MLLRFTAPSEAGLYQPPPPTSSEASTAPATSAASGDTGTASGLAARAATGASTVVQARANVAWRMRRSPARERERRRAAPGRRSHGTAAPARFRLRRSARPSAAGGGRRQLVRFGCRAIISRATSTNALNAGDTCDLLGK